MLTLCANSRMVPMGLLPVPDVARALRVYEVQVVEWCRNGVLRAEKHRGTWWVRVDVLTDFIEHSSWVMVAAPNGDPVLAGSVTDRGRELLVADRSAHEAVG